VMTCIEVHQALACVFGRRQPKGLYSIRLYLTAIVISRQLPAGPARWGHRSALSVKLSNRANFPHVKLERETRP
jgi:hypothetical protein